MVTQGGAGEKGGLVWRAQPRQAQFLMREEDEVLYGGAVGGGKTDALLAFAIMVCQRYPGARGLFLRRTYHDLSLPGAAIDRSKQLLSGYAKWNAETYTWVFATGAEFAFGHLENMDDVYQYQGAQPAFVCWDEITQFLEEQYAFIRSRVRSTIIGLRPKIRAATNPGGVGHGWVRKRWIDAAPSGTPFRIKTSGKTTSTGCFIAAKLTDNYALMEADPEYINRMRGLPEHMRRAFLEGDWDVFAGQFFTEWSRERHMCKPFTIPVDWERWRAYDYGMAKPGGCLWFARAPSGVVYIYREFYPQGMTAVEQGRLIREASMGERIRYSVGDPACFSRQPNGMTIAYDLAIGLQPANNDRKAGWQKVHEFMRWTAARVPQLQVFETCRNLIRTLPELVYDQHKVEDLDVNGEDHLADCLRYGLMGAAVKRHKTRVLDFAVLQG